MATFNELLADTLRVRTLRLLRVDAGQRKEIIGRLRSLQQNLLGELAKADFGTRPDLQQARIDALLVNATELIRETYAGIRTWSKSQLRELAEIEAAFAKSTLNRTARTEIASRDVPAATLDILATQVAIDGSPAEAWWAKQAGDFRARFADLIVQGVPAGRKIDDLVKDTRKLGEMSRRNAEALVRTAVQKVANDARIESFRANRDIIKGIMQLSTLDGRTTVTCAAYSNATWDLDFNPIPPTKLPWNGGPPRHFNCRSTTTPITKSFRELGIDADELEPGVRASMDGDVPADLSFDDWLKSKDKSFQDDLLGVGKADLWRRGKLSMADLLDEQGRELTLAELKQRYS
ncbi:phage head morphogenesis protein (plasmid) [Azospirillum baldaniorum]|uniref:Phage head morphogenesis domain-containing protein n=1 Tax=Azospirillum baldaniorum TaxID=1064539 RepID=A0A9P1JY58_9PROT|nr:phage minor head protein [Azospirillum baldaniorum]AWJ93837.1 phage head morphogenesis protein [Azospirillum baldaniorum]TWA81660.1 SPP1 gp7 family putative phage head morphogenesis protein [Azospirillum brasilense]CCD01996.1 conserved protein of unknown function [Azospirillum baldaniorum]